MKGDFTRFTFKRRQHYNAVRMQQGRVQMDADWNEQIDIQAHRERTEMRDIIGRCGVPEGEGGFRVAPIDAAAGDPGEVLAIAPGRIYIDGILCELEPSALVTLEGTGGEGGHSQWRVNAGPALRAQQWVRIVGGGNDGTLIQVNELILADETASDQRAQVTFSVDDLAVAVGTTVSVRPLTTYEVQPDYPEPTEVTAGTWLAYLDVWERHITALDDPAIREVALLGPDTATRSRIVWQVKLQEVTSAEPSCDDFVAWAPTGGRLAARAEPGGDDTDPCIIPEDAGYRRLENQLYRVEIHDDGRESGTPTFKWSRDNGSLVVRLVDVDTVHDKIEVSHPRNDPISKFATDDWVEILDEAKILRGEPGIFIQIGEIEGNHLAIKDNPSGDTLPTVGIVRRWEGGPPTEVDPSDWIALESGVEIRFDATSFHNGDYWTIPARTVTHDVEWPRDPSSDEPLYLASQGILHHTCPLALLEHAADGDWTLLHDCRDEFPPLTDLSLDGCCLRVDPGDDLQQAVDRVIQDGGGCICLGAGVHEHSGLLRIHEANNLTLYGEGHATVLRLVGDQESGQGGLGLMNSQGIHLERMLLLGIDVDAVVSTHGDPETASTRYVVLRDVAVLNLTGTSDARPAPAALRLAYCSDITLTNCALIGENGLVSTFGNQLPYYYSHFLPDLPLTNKYGRGVKRLILDNVSIRYTNWGIWSLLSNTWRLDGCDLRAISQATLIKHLAGLNAAPAGALPQRCAEALGALLREDGDTDAGIALKAFVWRDGTLHNNCITSAKGVEIWWCLRGQFVNGQIETREFGLHADWLHDSQIDANRFLSSGGHAISFVGSYRARLINNHIRAASGIRNLPWQARLFDFLDYVQEVESLYPIVLEGAGGGPDHNVWLTFWMLCRETAIVTGLSGFINDALQATLPLQQRDYAYFVLSVVLYYWLLNYQEEAQDSNQPNTQGLTAIAPAIVGNDVTTTNGGIALDKLLFMGGCRIADNRLHNDAGRAVQLNAMRMFENVHLVNALWRFSFKEMIETYLPGRIAALEEAGNTVWIPVVESLLALVQDWSAASEGFMEADYRVDGNTIHSQGTAVASNLWELVVARNHITLREQGIGIEDGLSILEVLSEYAATRGLWHAVREGTSEGIRSATDDLSGNAVLDDPERRGEAAEALHVMSARVTDPRMREYANEAGIALNNGDLATLAPYLERLAEWLAASVDNHGILLRNPGCRVTDNHVLVPTDVDVFSWARGGITLSTVGGEGEQGLGSMELLAILALLGVGFALDPVVGITETLIADNEVVGGYGHGVYINSPIILGGALGDTRWGLPDTTISRNQIRGMGGAGVAISDETYAVGVDLIDNQIIDCSSRPALAAFTSLKGGMVIGNAGLCRVQNNRIVRCGNNLSRVRIYGVSLDTVLGAQIEANQILSNGSLSAESTGGLYLKTVVDGASIHDNRFDRNIGWEIAIDNDFTRKEVPPALIALATLYGRRADSGDIRPSAISIQDNRIHARYSACAVGNVDELTFAGNQVLVPTDNTANFVEIDVAVISHNRINVVDAEGEQTCLSIQMNRGSVLGNVTDLPIEVKRPSGASVEHGLNVPAVILVSS